MERERYPFPQETVRDEVYCIISYDFLCCVKCHIKVFFATIAPHGCGGTPAAAAGLLLWARRARDIDQLLQQ